jgi:hypothetical protein
VAAVIAMTEIGQGSKAALQKGIASMGANTLMIFAGTTTTGGVYSLKRIPSSAVHHSQQGAPHIRNANGTSLN